LLSGAVALLGLAVVNPDAWIAEHNLDRYAETGRIDWSYLRGLSDDAVPALTGLPDDLQRCALGSRTPSDDDWLEWNLGRARAADPLDDAPPTDPTSTVDVLAGCPGSE
jgi:two-component system, OmpR family, sensor histidine kinase BaeS